MNCVSYEIEREEDFYKDVGSCIWDCIWNIYELIK